MTSNSEEVNVIEGVPFTHVDEALGVGEDVSTEKESLLVMSWRGSLTSLIFLFITPIMCAAISAGWTPAVDILQTSINTINKRHRFITHLTVRIIF
ncbi:hypothetical protein NUKP84_43730 [Klebsiella variicola]|nr:hypothetical protein NUKP84_43730 [Klebsiella variicola]